MHLSLTDQERAAPLPPSLGRQPWEAAVMVTAVAAAVLVLIWWRESLFWLIPVLLGVCALLALVLWWDQRRSEAALGEEIRALVVGRRGAAGGLEAAPPLTGREGPTVGRPLAPPRGRA